MKSMFINTDFSNEFIFQLQMIISNEIYHKIVLFNFIGFFFLYIKLTTSDHFQNFSKVRN